MIELDKEQILLQLKLLNYQDKEEIFLRFILQENLWSKKVQVRKLTTKFPNIPLYQIARYQEEGYGAYLVINGGGYKDHDVKVGRAIFYEHDQLSKEEQKTLWEKLNLPEPTFQIDTGGRSIHSYWVFKKPISIEDWRRLQADLLNYADADRSIKNPSRLMRLAGCFHVRILEYKSISC